MNKKERLRSVIVILFVFIILSVCFAYWQYQLFLSNDTVTGLPPNCSFGYSTTINTSNGVTQPGPYNADCNAWMTPVFEFFFK